MVDVAPGQDLVEDEEDQAQKPIAQLENSA
jgi:hypothetical protein